MNQVRKEFTQPQNVQARKTAASDPNRLAYHLMAPVGWMNDPNGLCQFQGIYHIFYQYTPGDANGQDHRGWGHYTTRDFIHYQEQDDPFVPDTPGDAKGSYSGSAWLEDGVMHLFYTGNNKLPGDYDYINQGRTHYVIHSQSSDGLHFSPKEVLLKNEDYPAQLSCHVRDPKIIARNGKYYMVLGARTRQGEGEVHVFESTDLKHWSPVSAIRPDKWFGYMWECPDLFELDGKTILITCPQGVETQGILYENVYQNGWFEVKGSLDHDQHVKDFHTLDYGFDFYAPQTFEDEKGRRILIGWMGMPDAPYTNPSVQQGWQHALTLPRQLHFENGKLMQFPIEEILCLRKQPMPIHLQPGICVQLPSACFDLQLHFDHQKSASGWSVDLRKDCTLRYENQVLTLDLHGKSGGRTRRHLQIEQIDSLEIFSDTSSLEIFVNQGEAVFSTRIYDDQKDLMLCADTSIKGTLWEMGSFEIHEKLDKKDPLSA